jgi:hypothetical protein
LSINWNNIRAIEGQREGFEELLCQLAGQEKIPNQVKFTRIGKPDGGKECYWELTNGDIHCWQAKFFMTSLTKNQWAQVDKSVIDAIDNHPKLIKYYVSMPVDRPDGKGRGKSMLQKWNDHVADWQKYALTKNMVVSFEYWGKHELEKRLRKPENEGLIYYFFNRTELTDQWFDTKNQESIDALGGRYTPELNFDLPLLSFHDGFTRDQNFSNQINSHYEEVLEKRRRAYLQARQKELVEKISNLDKAIVSFRKVYENINFSGVDSIPFESIKSELKCVDVATGEISRQLHEWRKEEENLKRKKGDRIDNYSRPYNSELHEIRELSKAIIDFYSFLDSELCKLANEPYLILVGPAGIGKSHALADLVSGRKSNNQISLLLLGENFSTNEMPWTQILRNQLRFNGNEDVLLGALNAKAESQQNRIIIVIDALNEGNGRRVWPKKLKSFIRSFQQYPWLGLIVSIRDSFEDLIAPESKVDDSIASRIYHAGFEGMEYEASIQFFKHYDIIPPGSPLLHPEFQNPLFLKLFCEGLEKKGLKQVPDGYQGISAIIENYLEGVEEKLAQPDGLDYDIKLKLVRKAVDALLGEMVEIGKDHLSYEKGEEITNNLFSSKCASDDRQYLKRLISEGIINEDLYWKEGLNYDGIHFAYQRFQDHLIVSALLEKYLDTDNPKKSFSAGPLNEFLANESNAYFNQNIIEALSVQVPERIGIELHEVAPYASTFRATARAFIAGLIWRRSDTIGESSREYVNQVIGRDRELFYSFLEVSISMATKPEFYFNADRLHKNLIENSLAKRDEWWTTWLQDKYGEHSSYNSVKRLINWAWNDEPHKDISYESVRLAGVMLAWFLTSSNRYLRDSATKALVCLFQNRISVFVKVLQQFNGVNDPYVAERLYAVAYGCSLRTKDIEALVPLSNYIYKTIFDNEEVYPHILLRDYARGVIEYTIYLGLELDVEIERIRPPYKSAFPDKLPTNEEIDAKYQSKGQNGHHGGKEWGATAILSSMTTEYGRGVARYGDFGRYVFQGALSNWTVNCDLLSNYAIQRIFELGYDPVVFSDFDAEQKSYRGEDGLKERIGKKYQWLAFHEILAKVSDNYPYVNVWHDCDLKSEIYKGSWSLNIRDIDPSNLIKKDLSKSEERKLSWYIPVSIKNMHIPHNFWISDISDIPKPSTTIELTDPSGEKWLVLESIYSGRSPKILGQDKWDHPFKKLWCQVRSYIIHKDDKEKFIQWGGQQDFWGRWMPESNYNTELFSWEYYWSPCWDSLRSYGVTETSWVEICSKKSKKKIGNVAVTSVIYSWNKEYDGSKGEGMSMYKPSEILFDVLNLKISEKDGQFLNMKDEVVCVDPSIFDFSKSCLLVKKDYLFEKLEENNLDIMWTLLGEKQILGGENESQITNRRLDFSGFSYLDCHFKIQDKITKINYR